jgi:hypothetical protein
VVSLIVTLLQPKVNLTRSAPVGMPHMLQGKILYSYAGWINQFW